MSQVYVIVCDGMSWASSAGQGMGASTSGVPREHTQLAEAHGAHPHYFATTTEGRARIRREFGHVPVGNAESILVDTGLANQVATMDDLGSLARVLVRAVGTLRMRTELMELLVQADYSSRLRQVLSGDAFQPLSDLLSQSQS